MDLHAETEAAVADAAGNVRRQDSRSRARGRLHVRAHVVVTGAKGLVGGEFVRRARAVDPDLVVTEVSLRAPWPEIDLSTVTAILHCAADTRFGRPIEEMRAANVEGTRRMIDQARRAPKIEKFGYVSTVFVAGATCGCIPEDDLRHGNAFLNTYQQSKYEAEGLVLEAMRELPASIYRLSSTIGDSRTGEVRQFNYTHQVLRLFPRSPLEIAPGDPGAPVDMIASDWAGSALAHLFARAPAGIYHLCAGAEASLTVEEMIGLAKEAIERHPRGAAVRVPRLVGLEEWRAFADQAMAGGDRLLAELVRVLGWFLPHLAMRQCFSNARSQAALEGSGITLPPIREYFPKMIAYCLDTNWGRIAT